MLKEVGESIDNFPFAPNVSIGVCHIQNNNQRS